MKAEIGKSLVERGAERLDTAGRWGSLAALVLLFLHVFTFSPYLEARQELSGTRAQKNALGDIQEALNDFGSALRDFQDGARERIEGEVADLLDAKISDFEALDRRVRALRAPNGELPAPAPGASARLQTQRAPAQDRTSALPPLGEDLVEKVREVSRNGRRLREILRPYIEAHIIQPRFDQLNSRLQEQVVPELRRQLDEVKKLAARVETEIAELGNVYEVQPPRENLKARAQQDGIKGRATWEHLWQSVESALTESEAAVGNLSLRPPDDEDWWVSVETKANTLAELGRAAIDRLKGQEAAAVAKKLNARLERALKDQGRLEQVLSVTLEDLEEQFAEQQKQIQSLGQPFAWIALDLDRAASKFPLLIALILGAVSLARSQRMHKLAIALQLLPEDDALWSWYFRRTTGPPAVHSRLPAGLTEFVGAVLWVTVAIMQIKSPSPAWPTFVASYGLLAAAWFYRQWVLREAHRLSRGSVS